MDSGSLLPGILLLQQSFNLVLIDLPRGDGACSLESYASDVCEVVKQLSPASSIGILGHSFGGYVAVEALLQAPAFFDFAILCNTFSNVSDGLEYISYTSKLLHAPSADEIESAYNCSPKRDEDFKQLMLGYAPLYFPELSPEDARAILSQWSYDAASYNNAVANIYSKIDLTQKCRHIAAKCLVIGGARDKVVSPNEVDRLVQLMPNAKGVKMANVGHFPFLTASSAFQRAVDTWYSQLS